MGRGGILLLKTQSLLKSSGVEFEDDAEALSAAESNASRCLPPLALGISAFLIQPGGGGVGGVKGGREALFLK